MEEIKIKLVFFLLAVVLGGCFSSVEDVVQKPSPELTYQESYMVVRSAMRHNFYDQASPNIKIIATPYYPSVVLALNRSLQRVKHWNDDEYRRYTDTA